MVAYSFKARFAAPILAGTKRQTIRADRKRHARPGEELQLYTGMRTRHCKLIGRAECMQVRPIRIHLMRPKVEILDTHFDVWEETRTRGELDHFAVSDGFKDWADLAEFWGGAHQGVADFAGVLITWSEVR